MQPYYQDSRATIYNDDAINVYPLFDADTFDLLFLDPPYYKVKMECAWDRQWDTAAAYLEWIGQHAEQWQRILKPNGSLFVCASSRLSWQVQGALMECFNVLNAIVWEKEAGWHHKCKKDELRSYTDPTETIFFCEHYGADNIAKGEAGYIAKCDELRGFVFEPIRAYLETERQRARISKKVIAQFLGVSETMVSQHYFSASQWGLPTEHAYKQIRECLNNHNHGGEYLRREYEDLRREYEDLRRPFFATPEKPFTSVWHYETVQSYDGKHPAEKPLAMLRDVIETTTRPGAVVGDFFMGSGTTLVAGAGLGRKVYGCDMSEHWCEWAKSRIEVPPLFAVEKEPIAEQLSF